MTDAEKLADALITKTTSAALLQRYEIKLKSLLEEVAERGLKQARFYKSQLDRIKAIIDTNDVDDAEIYIIQQILKETYDDDAGHGDTGGIVDNSERSGTAAKEDSSAGRADGKKRGPSF